MDRAPATIPARDVRSDKAEAAACWLVTLGGTALPAPPPAAVWLAILGSADCSSPADNNKDLVKFSMAHFAGLPSGKALLLPASQPKSRQTTLSSRNQEPDGQGRVVHKC